jgi:integrase/recombinase XerD
MAEITQEVALIDLDRLDLEVQRVPGAAVVAYLGRLAPGSRRTMAQSLRFLAEEFSQGKATPQTFPWERLTYLHTSMIRTKLAERYAPATANKMISALRGVLKECWRLGLIHVEVMQRAADIPPIKGTRTPKGRALTENELDLLILHCDNLQHRTLVRFLAQTGLRREECARLRWEDIDSNAVILVRGKGDKERHVPIPNHLISYLSVLPSMSANRERRVFNVSASRIWQILREASFQAQIPPVAPHDLRRTYATNLLAAGVDLPTVQRLMGHSNPRTTAGYDRRGIEEARAAVDRVFV